VTLAHGIGGVEGLPLDAELVLQTGGVVVLLSFLAVALLWRAPRFTGPVSGVALPAVPQAVGTGVQAVMLVLACWTIGWGLLGPQDPDANPAPRALYVLLWVGLVPLSLLLGPVWRVANPLRLAARIVAGALGRREFAALPAGLGYRPAALALLAFVWLELVPSGRDAPAVVGWALLGYAAVQVGAGVRYGQEWFARGDAFEVYSTLTAALAPIGRLADGRVGLRNPFRGLAAVPVEPGLVPLLAVWWGSTVFDGLTGWAGWRSLQLPPTVDTVADTAVLLATVLLVGVLYRLATGRLGGQLASTLIPIAAGYTIAHYVTLLLVEAPRGLAQLGGAQLGPVAAVPAPGLVAAIQIGAVLAGHVVAVVAAHDRSVALLPERRRLADQIPLVLLMVAYTMAGLFLLVIS
jgi:hypothetical protein